ncbi:MAG: hypothetical protein WAR79_11485 [Melioribacteraceae bacterium]
MKNIIVIFSIVIFATIFSFLIWHYFFSIYEVKFLPNFKNSILKTNSEYFIEFYGINSFGQKLSFRKIEIEFEFLEGKELISEENIIQNKLCFSSNEREGKIVIKINSKFSLNPTILTYFIKN